MSKSKVKERADRKERIAHAAIKLFAERGLEGTKMEDIAAEAGFGRASLYYYFPAREDIFDYVFQLGWTRLLEAIEEDINSTGSPRERFMRTLKKINSVAQADRSLYTFLFTGPRVLLSNPAAEQSWKPLQERLYTVLRGLLEDGIAAGEIPEMPAGVLLRAIGGLFHGLLFLGDGKRRLRASDVEELVDRLLNPGIGAA